MRWFKHDTDAHSDAKLQKLRIRYGAEGYGIYWYCLELIAGNIDQHNLTFELEHDAEIIAHAFSIHIDSVQEIMAYMCDLGLFESQEGIITCLKLAKRLDQSMTSNTQFRQALSDLNRTDHDGVMTESCKKRIEENRREDTARGKTPTKFTPCPYQEILKLYHEKLPMCPRVVRLSEGRKRSIKARWQNGMSDLDAWEAYFTDVSSSRWLTGKVDPLPGRKQFIADIDFLIRESTIIKTQEGKYHG
jgi:hypothetical protein